MDTEKCVYFCLAEHGVWASLHLEGPSHGVARSLVPFGAERSGTAEGSRVYSTNQPIRPLRCSRSRSRLQRYGATFNYRRSG